MSTPQASPRLSIALLVAVLCACRATPSAPPAGASPEQVAAPAAAPSHATVVQRVIDLGRDESHVQEYLHHLCLDIGPRLTGSTGLQKAVEWTRDEFARLGLTASIETWGEIAVGFDRGPWSARMLAPVEQELAINTAAWSAGTNGPRRGPALAAPATEEELAALAGKFAGAWVVRAPSGGKALSAKVARLLGEALQAEGALGEIRGARSELLLTGGNHRLAWDKLPTKVSITMRNDHHEELWERLGKGEAVELEIDVDNRFVEGPIPQYNVVADLVGSERPDEFVLVGGHLDSWDGAHGAVDNGTGCATALEAARLLVRAGARPARTIRFVLWSGEEQGLLGSNGYVKAHAVELPKISAVLNHDGGTNYLSGLRVTYEMEPQMREACAPLFGLEPDMPFAITAGDGLQARPDSDHWPYFEEGVPAFFWEQTGRSDYNRMHHTQFDTFDAAIPEYQVHSAIVVAVTAYGLADLRDALDRTNITAPAPRRMGVELDGNKLTRVSDDGRAKAAGLAVGDVVLSIDGVETKTRNSVTDELQKGGAQKLFAVQRGEEHLEFVLDYADDPDEQARIQRRALRAAQQARPARHP